MATMKNFISEDVSFSFFFYHEILIKRINYNKYKGIYEY